MQSAELWKLCLLKKFSISKCFWVGNSNSVWSWIELELSICFSDNSNLWSHLRVLAKWDYADLQSFQQGGAVFWDSASPDPCRDTCVWVKARLTVRRRCGAFGSISPPCSSKTALGTVLCFVVVFLVLLSDCLGQEISMPLTCRYVMVCVGHGSYVDNVITVTYAGLLLCIWKERFPEFPGEGAPRCCG